MKTTNILTCCSLLIAAAVISGCASDKTETGGNPASATKAAPTAKPASNFQKTQTAPAAEQAYKDQVFVANPSKIKFGEFKYVELKTSELKPEENSEGNRESAKKIDEMLAVGLRSIWPDLKDIPAGGDFSKSSQRTLQIIPKITHIRIVGPGARTVLTVLVPFGSVMAGGSDLVMHVDFTDSSTGEIIANPDFWQGNNAWAGSMTWNKGKKDNEVRDRVVAQIVGYTTENK
jgi:hypothetical protein